MRLNHVTVGVTNIERSVAFYTKLGLRQIVASHPHYARFECPEGDSTFSLHWLGPDVESVPQGATTVHFECDALDDKVAELKREGIAFDLDPTDQPYLWRERRSCAIPTAT